MHVCLALPSNLHPNLLQLSHRLVPQHIHCQRLELGGVRRLFPDPLVLSLAEDPFLKLQILSSQRLDFPLVVTEVDGAALASLTVRSHSALPVVVKLQSSMPAAITFQHENKNLHDAEDLDDDPEDWNQLHPRMELCILRLTQVSPRTS